LSNLGEVVDSVVETDYVCLGHLWHAESGVEFELAVRTTFGGSMTAGVIHENLALQPGGHAHDVRAVLRVERALVGEAQISLVSDGCGLESVARTFSFQITVCHGAEFLVDEWDQGMKGLPIASPPFYKQLAKRLGR
jgi:hypothetical protein